MVKDHDIISQYYSKMRIPTMGENIIATIKMRTKFCYPLKMVIFSNISIKKIKYWTLLPI